MKQRLMILVEVPDLRNVGSFKELYHNELFLDDFLSFDFMSVLSALRTLYPDDGVVISFMIG